MSITLYQADPFYLVAHSRILADVCRPLILSNSNLGETVGVQIIMSPQSRQGWFIG